MKKNDIYEIEITGMTHEALGVGKVDDMAVFVQGTIEGEKVLAKIIKVAKNYAVARVEQWLAVSPGRREPFCPVYKRCGGCSLQHMTYCMQLKFKHRVVTDNLERIGGFRGIHVNPVIGMENPMNYRTRPSTLSAWVTAGRSPAFTQGAAIPLSIPEAAVSSTPAVKK